MPNTSPRTQKRFRGWCGTGSSATPGSWCTATSGRRPFAGTRPQPQPNVDRPVTMVKTNISERSFGLSVGTACVLFAALSLWRGHLVVAKGLGVAALLLIVPAWLRPSLLTRPAALWARFSRVLGWVNGRVLLSAMFLLVLAPVAVLLRISGRDALRIRSRGGTSRWVPYPERYHHPTEEVMLHMARHVHRETGGRSLCLAGGVALNCVGNGRLLRDGPMDVLVWEHFIVEKAQQPAMARDDSWRNVYALD